MRLLLLLAFPIQLLAAQERARDLGVPLDGIPGRYNAITDVPAQKSVIRRSSPVKDRWSWAEAR